MERSRTWLAVGLVAVLMVAGLALAGCGTSSTTSGTTGTATETAAQPSDNVDVSGSDTMVKMAQKWAADYMATNANAIVSVKGGGSGVGIAALINGQATFADSSRKLKPEEESQATAKSLAS